MLLGILVLLAALTISTVAIYYSVAGLIAIFASAPLAIIVMGGSLEISKLITAVWLHKYWSRTTWWLKTYLTSAVIVLMLITSLGIFGFLSKAHIEQTAESGNAVAEIERVTSEIARQEAIIERADQTIQRVESGGTGADASLQRQIADEQARVDSAFERIATAETALQTRITPLETEISAIESSLSSLATALSSGDIETAQSIAGANVDGRLGPNTEAKISEFRTQSRERIDSIRAQIESIRASNPAIGLAQSQIESANELIARLRSQLGQGGAQDVDSIVDEQQERIREANTELDTLTEEKFQLEASIRELEAKVGPIRYVAEFLFEDANDNTLEEAVRWMIVIIIFVFDPLAVLLLIASQYTFHYVRENKEAQKEEAEEELEDRDYPTDSKLRGFSLMDTFEKNTEEEEEEEEEAWKERKAEIKAEEKARKEQPPMKPIPVPKVPSIDIDPEEEIDLEEFSNMTSAEKDRAAKYEVWDQDTAVKAAKARWKEEHPDQTLKEHKMAYIKGHIDELPWETYVEDPTNNSTGQDT